MSRSAEFSTPVRVYIEDTDAGGIVYYVNYLKFMERARTEFMRSFGYGKDTIFNHDLMFVVTDVSVRYAKPAKLDDALSATAAVVRARGATILFQQRIVRGDDLLAEGEISVACVDRAAHSPRRLPRALLARLQDSMA